MARPGYQQGITPPYQSKFVYNAPSNHRLQPDISINGDPASGSPFFYQGGFYSAGGTSASSPLLAGIAALGVQKVGQPVGGFNPFLYSHYLNASWRYDITSGYNGVYANGGWDYVTGLGSLKDVKAFLTAFLSLPTTTSLTSSLNPSKYGANVTFTAGVNTGGRGIPTGTVTFKDGAGVLGNVSLNTAGVATLSTNSLPVGSHSITAGYNGDNRFTGSSSGVINQTVSKAATNVALTSSLNPAPYANPVTFTVKVSSETGAVPPGGLPLKDNGFTLANLSLDVSGTASFTTAGLAQGQHNITADFAGDANFLPSSAYPFNQVINKAAVQVALTSSANPEAAGTSLTFSVKVTAVIQALGIPAGTVNLQEGSNTLASASLDGAGMAAFTLNTLPPGKHLLKVDYSGDSMFAAASSNTLNQSIITVNNVYVVTRPDDGGQVSSAETEGTLSFALKRAGTGDTITFSGVSAVQVTGELPPLQAGVWLKGLCGSGGPGVILNGLNAPDATDGLGVNGGDYVSGIKVVGFRSNQLKLMGTGNNFWCSVFSEAAPTPSDGVAITLTASANPVAAGNSFDLEATVSAISGGATPSGTVTFKEGSNVLGSSPLVNGKATFTVNGGLPAGTHTIVAVYDGDSTFPANTSSPLVLEVT